MNDNSFIRRLRNADKLQLVHLIGMLLRGVIWTAYARLIIRKSSLRWRTYCIDWPRLTHRNGYLRIGSSCFIGKGVLNVTEGATLSIGDRVIINSGFVVSANDCVSIGSDTMIGEYVSIRDSDHAFSDLGRPMSQQGMISAPIEIGEDVWIGRGAVILKGVTIGRGAVVGANAVVTRDVAPFDVVAGIPSRRLRSRLPSAPTPHEEQ